MLLLSQTPPEKASIHTAEITTITAMKEIKERDDIRWAIYTVGWSEFEVFSDVNWVVRKS